MKTKGKKMTSGLRKVTGMCAGKETSEPFMNKESEKKSQEKREVETSLGWSSVPVCSTCKYPATISYYRTS